MLILILKDWLVVILNLLFVLNDINFFVLGSLIISLFLIIFINLFLLVENIYLLGSIILEVYGLLVDLKVIDLMLLLK